MGLFEAPKVAGKLLVLFIWALSLTQFVHGVAISYDLDSRADDVSFGNGAASNALLARQSTAGGTWRCGDCFSDTNLAHFSNGVAASISPTGMTNEVCQDHCRLNGHYMFAVTARGTECWCGNETTINRPATLHAKGGCSGPSATACSGNPSTKCGARYRINICEWIPTSVPASEFWPREEPLDTWKCGRCYSDALIPRTLGGGLLDTGLLGATVVDPLMTNERCMTICGAQGYPFAGTEHGNACYCGSYPMAGARLLDNSQCNIPCGGNGYLGTGNPNEMCGDNMALSVCENRAGINYPLPPAIPGRN